MNFQEWRDQLAFRREVFMRRLEEGGVEITERIENLESVWSGIASDIQKMNQAAAEAIPEVEALDPHFNDELGDLIGEVGDKIQHLTSIALGTVIFCRDRLAATLDDTRAQPLRRQMDQVLKLA